MTTRALTGGEHPDIRLLLRIKKIYMQRSKSASKDKKLSFKAKILIYILIYRVTSIFKFLYTSSRFLFLWVGRKLLKCAVMAIVNFWFGPQCWVLALFITLKINKYERRAALRAPINSTWRENEREKDKLGAMSSGNLNAINGSAHITQIKIYFPTAPYAPLFFPKLREKIPRPRKIIQFIRPM